MTTVAVGVGESTPTLEDKQTRENLDLNGDNCHKKILHNDDLQRDGRGIFLNF